MKRMKKGVLVTLLAMLAMLCLALAACGGGGIKFKFVTGEGAPGVAELTVEAGKEVSLPDPPAWEGHSFEGWYLSEDFSGAPVTAQVAEKDTTFYAKWANTYLLTLDVGQGTLAQKTYYLKEGTPLSGVLQGIVPVRDGFEFGEWLNGTAPIASGATMPAQSLTLTAHYKVGYTVEVYLESLDGGTYEKGENFTAYTYATPAAFTPDYAPEGFTATEHEGEVRSKVLSETDPASNLFKCYYDRSTVYLYFRSNIPGETNAEEVSIVGKYGEKKQLPGAVFERSGYLLAGWSDTETGEAVYPVSHDLFNVGPATQETVELTASGVKYAVWEQGYTDIFGGSDNLFIQGERIYLSRASFLFEGEHHSDNLYRFYVDGKLLLSCTAYETSRTFCYSNTDRQSFSGVLLNFDGTVNDAVHIYFDAFNGVSYSQPDVDGVHTDTSHGTYTLDDSNYCHATFTDGLLAGKALVFVAGSYEMNDGSVIRAFQIRNEEDVALGSISYCMLTQTRTGFTVTSYGQQFCLLLDGFGYGTIRSNGEVVEQISYVIREADGLKLIQLYSGDGNSNFGTYVIGTFDGVKGFMEFNSSVYGTFKQGDATLTLDGTYKGTYTNGNTKIEGFFYSESSLLGETLVYLVSGTDTYIFSVSSELRAPETSDTPEGGTGDAEEGGEEEPEVVQTFKQYTKAYAELVFFDEMYQAKGVGYPYMIIGETAEDAFTLYVPDDYEENFYAVATGTLVFNEQTGAYHATVANITSADHLYNVGFDILSLKEFVFTVATLQMNSSSILSVMSWQSYTLNGQDAVGLTKTYTGKTEKEKLVVTSGFAAYTDAQGKEYTDGILLSSGGYYSLSYDDGEGFLLLQLDEEKKTFTVLDPDLLGYAYLVSESGEMQENTYLVLDGLGGAEYTVVTEKDDGSRDTVKTPGKIALTESSNEFGEEIYTFTSDDSKFSFRFVMFTDNNYLYYAPESETYKGTYTATTGEKLVLDGFSRNASYTTADGTVISGEYIVEEENLIYFETGEEDFFYFDVKAADRSLKVRGEEFFECYVVVNGLLHEECYSLDGYGHLEVFVMEGTGQDATKKTVGTGTYAKNNDGLFVITYTYTGQSEHVELIGDFVIVSVDDQAAIAFAVYYKEVATIYVDPTDWSVLELDGFGTAIRIGSQGVPEYGAYILITDDLLYYTNEEYTYASLYTYDAAKGQASAVDFGETGYYTENLDALLFSDSGYVIYKNDVMCYYYIEKDGNVTLYYLAEEVENVKEEDINKFGYVPVKTFGKLDDTITFEEKTYYRNGKIAITFKRTGNVESYPLPIENFNSMTDLTFAPAGEGDFTTRGQVALKVNGKENSQACTVDRVFEKDGSPSYHIMFGLDDGGFLELSIELTYHGEEGSTYEVTGMDYVAEYYAYEFLTEYYIMSIFGMSATNSYGLLQYRCPYNEEGEERQGDVHVEVDLYRSFAFTDSEGNTVEHIDSKTFGYYSQYNVVEFQAKDGYTYCLYYQPGASFYQMLGVMDFYLLMITREEKMKIDETHTVVAEHVIYSGVEGFDVGETFAGHMLDEEGTPQIYDLQYAYDNRLVFIETKAAEGADGDETPAGATRQETHYIVTLTNKAAEDGSKGVPFYDTATLETKTATYYSEGEYSLNGVSFYEDDTVAYVKYGEEYLAATKTEKDKNGVYTVEVLGGVFTVTKDGDKVTVDEVITEEEEDDWFGF